MESNVCTATFDVLGYTSIDTDLGGGRRNVFATKLVEDAAHNNTNNGDRRERN